MVSLAEEDGNLKNNILLILLSAVPLAALVGNAAADIALILVTVAFIVFSKSEWKHFIQSRFLWLATIFWIWIVLCSSLSLFPTHSYQDSVPYILFPLYAFALSQILSRGEGKYLRYFMLAAVAGTLIEFSFMIREYLFMHQGDRLYGTFGKLIPGWYLNSFGSLIVLLGFEKFRLGNLSTGAKSIIIFLTILIIYALIISGNIMSLITFIGTIILYFSARKYKDKKSIFILLMMIALIIFMISSLSIIDPPLYLRITDSIIKRMPWMVSSDYHEPWKAGINIAFENPIFGIGPKNFNLYCMKLQQDANIESLLNITQCPWHSHNLYISIAAESGIIGLILFLLIVVYILLLAFRASRTTNWENNTSFLLSFILFFPLQTYSQAFGQSLNFYFWTVFGYILFMIRDGMRRQGSDVPL